MRFEDWISKILESKLTQKCTKSEIDQITKEIIDDYSQMKNISFINKENEIILISMSEVLYINEYKKNIFKFYTRDGEYELFNKNIDITHLINDDFVQLDKSILVNMSKVRKYNSLYASVYFDDVVDTSSISVRVLVRSIDLVERKLGKENNLHDSSALYSPNIGKRKGFLSN